VKKFVYFSIFVSLLGAKVLSFGVGPYQMSLFRIAMILIIVVLFVTKNRDFILWLNGNMFSTVFMAFWCLYALVSIIWSKDISAWLRNMFFLFIALIVILVFNNVFQDKEDIISAFKAFQWGIIVQSIIGWYEVFTKNYLFVEINSDFERIYIKSSLRVPIAMTDNPNNFATLMFIGVFISYICICNSVAIEKQFYKIVLVSDVLLLLFTSSRANILALALSVLFWVAHHKGKLLVLLASCVFIFLLQPEVVIERLVELDFSSSAVMNSNNIRLNLILNGFKFLIDTYAVWFALPAAAPVVATGPAYRA